MLKALLLIGQLPGNWRSLEVRAVRDVRQGYSTGLAALLRADEVLTGAAYRGEILRCFDNRGIRPDGSSFELSETVEWRAA